MKSPPFLIPPKKFHRLPGRANLVIRATGRAKLPREGYRLTATSSGVEIEAADAAGEFYAQQTIRELAALGSPACRIEDWPDFSRRGVYLDCARGKVPTVATLKSLVEQLARWKINELQLYIKNAFTWRKHPAISVGFSPFTPDDLRAVQEHCRQYHIRFVPSLAGLSHMELTLTLPQYRSLAELPGALGWPGGTTLCPVDPGAIKLMRDLYAEFLPIFSALDFNAGCDEPWELGRGRSRRRVQRLGKGRVYLDFLLQLHRLCQPHGKRMNVWGDIVMEHPELLRDLPKDIVMLHWEYSATSDRIKRTAEFAAAGVPVMVCPGTGAWQSHGSRLANAIGNVANFAAMGRKCGAVGLLNTDWGDYGNRNLLGVSWHGYAHGAAHSWNGAAVNDATFTQTFTFHTFSDGDGRLAAALRQLGSADDDMVLYHALVEPVRLPAARFIQRFQPPSIVSHYPELFPERISQVAAPVAPIRWPAIPRALAEFERTALSEYRLAARMNTLAALRAQLGQRFRAGRSLPTHQFRAWADEMRDVLDEFAGLWRRSNRPARLADNLKLMRWAAQEMDELCRRR